jgi:Polyketide cyclase / dehydrase and lipid transport
VVRFFGTGIDSRRTSGGRLKDARRLVLVAAFLMLAVGTVSAAGGQEAEPQVTVREQNGVYSVTARFQVAQPPAIALAVLTDYDDIPRFMPQIKKSVVLERDGDHVVVEQEAVSRLFAFSKRVHLVLDITQASGSLYFRDRCGRSFVRYEGAWRMSEQHGRTEILYELTTQPAFDVPEFLVKRLLKRDSATTIDQLRREIADRSSPGGLKP